MSVARQTRSISWSAPADVRVATAAMDMLGYLTAVAQGELPNSPAIELLGMRLKSFGEGRAEVSFAPEEYHVNFVGAVHGGVISAVLDSCIGYAVNTTLGRDEAFVTSQLNVQFVRGIRIGTESLVARARLRHRGGRLAMAEASLEDASGTLYATATATCLILAQRST
jgi:uncharacterized protein (TIGR00369 family)